MIVNEKKYRVNALGDIVNKFNSFSKSEYWAILVNNDKDYEPDCDIVFIKDEEPVFATSITLNKTDCYSSEDKILPQNILNEVDFFMKERHSRYNEHSRYNTKNFESAYEKWNDIKVIVMCVG